MVWLLRVTGHPVGTIMPVWLRVVSCIVFPGRIPMYMAARVWSTLDFSINIEGVCVDPLWFRYMRDGTKPSLWFRVTGTRPAHRGVFLVIETAVLPGPSDPVLDYSGWKPSLSLRVGDRFRLPDGTLCQVTRDSVS